MVDRLGTTNQTRSDAPLRRGEQSSRRRPQVAPCVAAGESGGQRDGRAAVRRVKEEVALPFARDAPSAVVQLHVMEAAQQNASIDVGSALVAMPFIDVMRLAVRSGPVAAAPTAKHRLRIGKGAGAQYVDDQVVCELVVGAGVRDELFCARLLLWIDEPRAAASCCADVSARFMSASPSGACHARDVGAECAPSRSASGQARL